MRTTPPGFAADPERQQRRFVAHVVDAAAHEALHRVDACATAPSAAAAAPRGRRRSSRPRRRDTTDGTSASPRRVADHHRHAVVARRRPGCWSCRDRCRRLYPWLTAAGSSSARLAIDGREQVVDVVALEQPLAQRVERRALLGGGRRSPGRPTARSAPASCALVLLALRVDRLARRVEPRAQRRRIGARLAQLANLVELLVQREHFLEQRRRHLRPRARPPTSPAADPSIASRCSIARDRILQRAIRVVQIRRALEAREPLGRRRVVEVVRDETCGSDRGSAARDRARSITSRRGRPRNEK